MSSSGIITSYAGNGTYGFSGDGGPAASAQLWPALDVAVDGSGNLFISDYSNLRVRKVSPDGIITTVAGNGAQGFSGDGGPATSAQLNPGGLAVDAAGNPFICDSLDSRVRMVSAAGIITTVAGNGAKGFSGDGGPATSAALSGPVAAAVDGSGNLFIAEIGNNRVRMVSPSGVITTVAGNGTSGFSGDAGPATSARLNLPYGVAVDGSGNLFIGDSQNNRVRMVSRNGIITTVAGDGTAGYVGDGGLSVNAELYEPIGLAADGSGNVYVADFLNNAIRLLTAVRQPVLITAVLDAAGENAVPVSPGKIVVIYGAGLGPSAGLTASPVNGSFGTELSGTTVSFNGFAAPVFYTSATQVDAIVPYSISGSSANVTVAYQGQTSLAFPVSVAPSSPGLFTSNAAGAGQAVAINVADGSLNTAANPARVGDYVSLYATGEGQTTPPGVDGKLAVAPLPSPNLPVTVTVGGMSASVQYKGAVPGTVAGLMQVNIQIPAGVAPGGYVPVTLQVGGVSTVDGALWIAVAAK